MVYDHMLTKVKPKSSIIIFKQLHYSNNVPLTKVIPAFIGGLSPLIGCRHVFFTMGITQDAIGRHRLVKLSHDIVTGVRNLSRYTIEFDSVNS